MIYSVHLLTAYHDKNGIKTTEKYHVDILSGALWEWNMAIPSADCNVTTRVPKRK